MAHVGGMMGFGLGLQGRIEREGQGGATSTLEELLRESMNSSDRLTRRKTFKVRLGFNGCCGSSWGSGPSSNLSVRGDEEDHDEGGAGSPELESEEVRNVDQRVPENGSTPSCAGDTPASSGMNLAAALAAERQFRVDEEFDAMIGASQSPIRASNDSSTAAPVENGSPLRVSLMKLLEETDGGEMEKEGVGSDSLCCVCLGRKKGAAFIPCGHTFCRVCSRELWLNRGFCPLCNRSILEILDIF